MFSDRFWVEFQKNKHFIKIVEICKRYGAQFDFDIHFNDIYIMLYNEYEQEIEGELQEKLQKIVDTIVAQTLQKMNE